MSQQPSLIILLAGLNPKLKPNILNMVEKIQVLLTVFKDAKQMINLQDGSDVSCDTPDCSFSVLPW